MGIINHRQLEKGSQVTAVQLPREFSCSRPKGLICSVWALVPSQCTHPGLAVPTALQSFGFGSTITCPMQISHNQRTMWGGFARGTGDKGSWKNHMAHSSELNTHLKHSTKVELNTDLGLPGSNPGGEHSSKETIQNRFERLFLRAWSVHLCDKPRAKGLF